MGGDSLALLGLLVVLGGAIGYLALLFVVKGFTYRTWMFHATILAGMFLAVVGWLVGGNLYVTVAAVASGIAWFVVSRRELTLVGSKRLKLRAGDPMPAFKAVTTDGRPITEHDLLASAPTLLVLYRGWWCPSSKAQLDKLHGHYDQFESLGIAVFAGSVDSAADAAPLQERVGEKITILGDVPEVFLEQIGVRDERGAPWYDRLLFRAPKRAIAMPSALVVDRTGKIVAVHRAGRLDDMPMPTDILAVLRRASAADAV